MPFVSGNPPDSEAAGKKNSEKPEIMRVSLAPLADGMRQSVVQLSRGVSLATKQLEQSAESAGDWIEFITRPANKINSIRRGRQWVILFLIFAVVIPALAAVLANQPRVTEETKRELVELIREETGLEGNLKRIHFQLVPIAIVVKHLELSDPTHGRFLTAKEVQVRPVLSELFRGRVQISQVVIKKPEITVRIKNGKLANIHVKQKEGGAEQDIPLSRIEVLDGTIDLQVQDEAQGLRLDGKHRLEYAGLEIKSKIWFGDARIKSDFRGQWGTKTLNDTALALKWKGSFDETKGLLSTEVSTVGLASVLQAGSPPSELLSLSLTQSSIPVKGWPNAVKDVSQVFLGALPEAHGKISLKADVGQVYRLLQVWNLDVPEMKGRLGVEVDLKHTHRMEATASVDLEGGQIKEFMLGSHVHLPLKVQGNVISVANGRVDVPLDGGHVALDAQIKLEAEAIPTLVDLELHQLSFAKLMKDLDVSDGSLVEWIVSGKAKLKGDLQSVQLEGPIRFNTTDFEVTFGPYNQKPKRTAIQLGAFTAKGMWSIKKEGIRFYNLDLDLPYSHIKGETLLGFKNQFSVRAAADCDLKDLGAIAQFPISGKGPLAVEIDGTFQEPNIRGTVDLQGFEFDGMRLGHLASNVQLDPDGLGVHFFDLKAEKNKSTYGTKELSLNFRDNRFLLMSDLVVHTMALDDFYHVFGVEADERYTPYQGEVQGRAQLRYSNGYPGDQPNGTLRVGFDTSVPHFVSDEYAFTDGMLKGEFIWEDKEKGMDGAMVRIDDARMRKGDGTLVARGTIDHGALKIKAVAQRLAIQSFEGFEDKGLKGRMDLHVDVQGRIDAMEVSSSVDMEQLFFGNKRLPNASSMVRITHQNDPWLASAPANCKDAARGLVLGNWKPDPPMHTVEGMMERDKYPMAYLLCGGFDDGSVRWDLALGRVKALPLRGKVYAAGLDVIALYNAHSSEADLGNAPGWSTLASKGTGTLEWTDGGFRTGDMEGTLVAESFAIEDDDFRMFNSSPMVIEMKGSSLKIQPTQIKTGEAEFELRGTLDEQLALGAKGSFDLAALERFLPELVLSEGVLQFDVEVKGSVIKPTLWGSAFTHDSRFRLKTRNIDLRHVHTRLAFQGDKAVLQEARLETMGGTISGDGLLNMDGATVLGMHFNFKANDIGFEPVAFIDFKMDGQFELNWTIGERIPHVTGEVDLKQFHYRKPIHIGALGSYIAPTASLIDYDPSLDVFGLDIKVKGRGPLLVSNRLVETRLVIDEDEPLRMVGTNQRYGILGQMALRSGLIVFRNSRFEILHGSIKFEDETKIAPVFDVTARTDIRRSSDLSAPSWRVEMNAQGVPEDIRLQMKSDPYLSGEDIVLLLTMGMTRAEASQAGGVESAVALDALATLSGLDQEVTQAIPLIDDFRFSSTYSVRSGRTVPQLTVGKRLAEGLRVSATTGIADSREFRGGVEWLLSPQLSVQGGYDNYSITTSSGLGNVGLDLRYRIDFGD